MCYTTEDKFHRRWNVKTNKKRKGEKKKSVRLLVSFFGSSEGGKLAKKQGEEKTLVASARRRSLRFSGSALAARPLPVSLSPLSARGRAIQKQPSRNTVRARAVPASVVVRGGGGKKKSCVWGEKRSRVPSESQPREEEREKKAFLTSAKLPSPQLSGLSLVPFGRIFVALQQTFLNCGVLFDSLSEKSSFERVKYVSATFSFSLSPPRTHALTHFHTHHSERSLLLLRFPLLLLPPLPLTVLGVGPRGVVFRSLLSAPAPPPVTSREGRRERGRERWAEKRVAGVGAAWRVTPTHHEPGTEPASLPHAESPWRRPEPRSAEMTSHPSTASSARAPRLSSNCPFASIF